MTNYKEQNIFEQLKQHIKTLERAVEKLETLNKRKACSCDINKTACIIFWAEDRIHELTTNKHGSRLEGLLKYLDEEDY